MDFSLCLSEDHSGREEESGEDEQTYHPQISGGITKICTHCGAAMPIALKECPTCKSAVQTKQKRQPRKIKSRNTSRLRGYIKKYADTLRENVGSHVIVLYASTYTRVSKNGTETKVHDISSYATEGFGRKFIGEGGRNNRPEPGKKVISLLEAMLKKESASEPQSRVDSIVEPENEESQVENEDIEIEDIENEEIESEEVRNEEVMNDEVEDEEDENENVAKEPQREFQLEGPSNVPLASNEQASLKPPMKRKLGKGEADELWKKYKDGRGHIYWPTSSANDEDDMWGDKFWECSFGKETQKTVTVAYSGYYEDSSGNRMFDALGKCTVAASKRSLLEDWTIKLV